MTDYGATDTSTTPLGANQFPVSAVWVPGDRMRPLQGGTATTDGGGKVSAPAAMTLVGTKHSLTRATQTTTITSSTTETTIFTAVAATYLDVVLMIFSNTSSTATRVDIRDTTSGTVLGSVFVPALDMRGFAVNGASIPQTSVNTNWTAQCGTSVASLYVYVVADKN